jgi:hypothetical protein
LFDLTYDPVDYTHNPNEWRVPHLVSVGEARSAAARIAGRAVPDALRFFNRVQTLADLGEAFDEKRRRPYVRFTFENYTQEPLAFAFVLARLGKAEEARGLLKKFIEDMEGDGDHRGEASIRLQRLLAEAEGRTRSKGNQQ